MNHAKLNVGLVTTVSGRWPRELPVQRHKEYADWLAATFPGVDFVRTQSVVADEETVEKVVKEFKSAAADLVVVLIGAFTGDSVSVRLAEALSVPVILWAPREPSFDGGRLMANSLVAATMNSAALHRLGYRYHFIYGDYGEERIYREVARYLRVYDAIGRLRRTCLGLLGYRPPAFYSSTFDETLIRRKFGLRMEEFELQAVLALAQQVEQTSVDEDRRSLAAAGRIVGLPEGHLENHCRLYLAMKRFVAERGLDALALKCWPELGEVKHTPCAVLSRLADEGYVIGCETDVDATITMLVLRYLTDQAVFMGDLIGIDEAHNSALFWHCGQAARSLRDPHSEVIVSDHSLAGQGVVFETTLKPGRVTLGRLSNLAGDYKLFLAGGEAVPTRKAVRGAMVSVILDEPVLKLVYRIAEEGVPHHYSIVWEDVVEDMRALCRVLGIDTIKV